MTKIYRNETPDKWYIKPELNNFINIMGNEKCGIGILDKFIKENKDKEFLFVRLGTSERYKEKEFKDSNKNKNEILLRYISETTIAGGMIPLCVVNIEKGYIRLIENIEEADKIEDIQWSKPLKLNYIRTTF